MNVRVDLQEAIRDGMEVVFKSPVDCSQVSGLILYYPENGATSSKEFAFADAHGNNVGDIDHLFAENVVVKVILDVTSGMAFVQNADTNAYIERTFAKVDDVCIIPAVSGETISVADASGLPLKGLKIHGNTTQNGTPSPASPVELVSPGNGGNIKLSVTGKNLIDCAEATAVYRRYVNIPAALQPGTYTISGIVESTDTDAEVCNVGFDGGSETGGVAYVSLRRNVRNAATVTLHNPVSTVFFNASDISDHSKDDTLTLREIQLEPGTKATDYEPYQGQSLTVHTPNGLYGIDDAKDEIDLAGGVQIQRIKEVVFTGDEVWQTFPDYPHLFYTMTGIQAARNSRVLCSHFPYDPGGLMEGRNGCRFTANGNSQFYISSALHTSVADFKAWLKENPVTMQCILAEPVETPLSDDEVSAFDGLHSYYPNTTVYNDADAYMNVWYVADTKTYVDNHTGGGGSVPLETIVEAVLAALPKWEGGSY